MYDVISISINKYVVDTEIADPLKWIEYIHYPTATNILVRDPFW